MRTLDNLTHEITPEVKGLSPRKMINTLLIILLAWLLPVL